MENKFFLYRIKIFTIIFCNLIFFVSIQFITHKVLAQSLLSDRQWLEQILESSKKNDNIENNNPLLPSDLFFTPTSLPNNKNNKVKDFFSKPSSSLFIDKKPLVPSLKRENLEKIPSGAALARLFPWFSGQESSKFVSPNDLMLYHEKRSKLANLEFSGIFMWVSHIEKLLSSDPEEAMLKFLEIEEKLNLEDRTLLKIQLFYFLGEWVKAEKLANAFLRERTNSDYTPTIFFYLNKSLLAQEKTLNQDLILREITIKNLEPKLRSDFLQILSDEALSKGNVFRAIKYRLEDLIDEKTSKFASLSVISRMLKEVKSIAELEILSENYPNLIWLQEEILSIEVELLLKQQRYREALSIVDHRIKRAEDIGDEKQVESLERMEKTISKALNTNPRRIGVILPMSSSSVKVSKLAQETLNGLWLALRADKISAKEIQEISLQKTKTNSTNEVPQIKIDNNWELVIRDSHLNIEITKNVIRELVEKQNVIAIIGPLARKTSEAAAEVAEDLRVPLISLSLTDSIPKLGDYIFRNNQSWKQEVVELLDYAVSELQACRFLILFAETREGRQKMRHFWDEALKKGCEIFAVEGFKDEGQKSLVNEFDTFTGKNFRTSIEERKILKELKEKEDPIHNFDAVFVAVGSGGVKNLRLIFPYSSVYKMEKSNFLGDSGWNDAAIQFAPGLRGVRNSIFVDSFFLRSKTPAMEKLLNLHERVLYRHQNYAGPSSYTAYAYDTLLILTKLLKDGRNKSHRELRKALLNMEPFPGVTGNLWFNKNGEIQRDMKLLTLKREKIQPLIQK